MNTTELNKLTDAQLIGEADKHLSQVDESGGLDKSHLMILAQFYLAEVTRREQARQYDTERRLRRFELSLAIIELLLTIVIVWMIGVELKDATRQATILQEMNAHTLEQATLIQSMLDQQKSMLDTVRDTNQNAQQQLEILSNEQRRRLAEEARHPEIRLFLGDVPIEQVQKSPVTPVHLQTPNGPDAGYARLTFVIENVGDQELDHGLLYAAVTPESVTLDLAGTRGFNVVHRNQYSTTLVTIPPHSKVMVEFDVSPWGAKEFDLNVSVEAPRIRPYHSQLRFAVK